MPLDAQLDKYYRESVYYEDKDPYAGDFYDFSYKLAQSRLRLLDQYVHLDGGKRWLDIGAGNAVLGQALKEMQQDATYDAVEPSLIRQKWGDWVSSAFDDLSRAPLESYNVITLNQVLEHLNHPLQFLKEIAIHLKKDGLILIDVPYRDDMFKPSIEPHLLFWEKGSLSHAVEQAGLKILFCDSVGMKWGRARQYFKPTFINKLIDPWRWIVYINRAMASVGIEKQLRTFARFQADTYGGNRHWLRCIAKKVV